MLMHERVNKGVNGKKRCMLHFGLLLKQGMGNRGKESGNGE